MSSSFTTVRLVNSRTVIKGTDVFGVQGETTVDSTQWDDVAKHTDFELATADFEAAVEAFFQPITDAADKLDSSLAKSEDPATFVVLHEATRHANGEEEVRIHLNKDSIALRLIEAGDTDRLVWVDGNLEILEASSIIPMPAGTVKSLTQDEAIALLKRELGAEVVIEG